jgi:DNA transformation protein
LIDEVVLGPPYPGAKLHICITADQWDDRMVLGAWVRAAAEARHAAAVAKASRPSKPIRTGNSKKAGSGWGALAGLGPMSQQMLKAAGIGSAAQLRTLGAVKAYAQVKAHSPRASLNLLWALEGALTGLHWQVVAREYRTSLLLALEQVQSPK